MEQLRLYGNKNVSSYSTFYILLTILFIFASSHPRFLPLKLTHHFAVTGELREKVYLIVVAITD